MRFSGLLHGKVSLSPDSESASGEERHGLIQGFGCTVGRTHREGDSQVSRVLIGERHHPCWASSKRDGIGQPPFSGRVRHGVDRLDDPADPVGQAVAVGDRDSAEAAHQVLVPWRRGASAPRRR